MKVADPERSRLAPSGFDFKAEGGVLFSSLRLHFRVCSCRNRTSRAGCDPGRAAAGLGDARGRGRRLTAPSAARLRRRPLRSRLRRPASPACLSPPPLGTGSEHTPRLARRPCSRWCLYVSAEWKGGNQQARISRPCGSYSRRLVHT